MTSALIVHLYRRLMSKGRVIALLALSAVPGLAYWLTAFDAGPAEQGPLYPDILATAGFSFAIAVLILTVATLRDERDAGTLPYLYMRPIARPSFSAWSIASGLAAGLTIALGGWLATVAGVVAVGADVAQVGPGLALFTAAAFGYSAVFVPLGYLVPRSLLIGLGYIIVIESILASVVTGLANFSIWRISLSIYLDLIPSLDPGTAGEVLGPVAAGIGGGVAKLAGVMVLGWAVLTSALRRRDAL